MRFVQALHWLRDMLPSDDGSLRKRLVSILRDPDHGQAIQDDLRKGLSALPEWMRVIVRDLLQQTNAGAPPPAQKAKPSRRALAPAPIMKRDKIVILHGLRRWWDRRGELKEGRPIARAGGHLLL